MKTDNKTIPLGKCPLCTNQKELFRFYMGVKICEECLAKDTIHRDFADLLTRLGSDGILPLLKKSLK